MTNGKAPADKEKKVAETPAAAPAAGMSTPNWEALLGKINQKQTRFLFPTEGRTRVRVVLPPDITDPMQFATPTVRYFKGAARKKYVLSVVQILHEDPEERTKVVPMIVPKQVVTGIIQQLIEGYEIFDLVEGHAIAISRSGKGLDTDYGVTCAPKPSPLDGKKLTWPDKTMAQIAIDFEKDSQEYDAQKATEGNGEDELDEAVKTQKGTKEASLGGNADW